MIAAFSCLALIVLLFAYGMLFSERPFAKALLAEPLSSSSLSEESRLGLRRALRLCHGDQVSCLPELFVFPDTLPKACVIRAPGRSGRIFVSQGMAVMFRDDEMAAVLKRAKWLLARRGIFWKSACVGWLARTIRAPRGRKLPVTPLRVLGASLFFPTRTFMEHQQRCLDVFESSARLSNDEPAWLIAAHKVSRAERIFS